MRHISPGTWVVSTNPLHANNDVGVVQQILAIEAYGSGNRGKRLREVIGRELRPTEPTFRKESDACYAETI